MSTLPLHTECLTAGSATYGYSAEVTDGVSATLVEMNAKPVFVVVLKMYILCSMNLAPPPDIWGLTNGMFQRLIFYYIENHTLLSTTKCRVGARQVPFSFFLT